MSWLVAQTWCWAPSLGGLGKGASSFEGASLGLKEGKDTALLIREREREAGPGVGGRSREAPVWFVSIRS